MCPGADRPHDRHLRRRLACRTAHPESEEAELDLRWGPVGRDTDPRMTHALCDAHPNRELAAGTDHHARSTDPALARRISTRIEDYLRFATDPSGSAATTPQNEKTARTNSARKCPVECAPSPPPNSSQPASATSPPPQNTTSAASKHSPDPPQATPHKTRPVALLDGSVDRSADEESLKNEVHDDERCGNYQGSSRKKGPLIVAILTLEGK